MSKMVYSLNDVACTGCIGNIRNKMQKSKGIENVRILYGKGKIEISYNERIINLDEIIRNLHKLTLRTFD